MLVFKFGGASVKNADAVRNIVGILKDYKGEIVVVISAMGKTTNNLERIIDHFVNKNQDGLKEEVEILKTYHYDIINDLFEDIDRFTGSTPQSDDITALYLIRNE